MDAVKQALDGKVTRVALSNQLKEHPVSLSADGPISLEMEKVLSRFPQNQAGEMAKSNQVLNINSQHPVFAALARAHADGDEEKLKEYAAILYDQARLIEGLPLEDPAAFARRVAKLMI